jgi:hypothetical protein
MRHSLFVIFFFSILQSSGQDSAKNKIASNTIYVEGLGAGMRFSLNYEKIFRLPIHNLYVSGSAGIAPSWWDYKYLYLPLRVNLIYIFNRKSSIEIAVTLLTGYHWTQSYLHPEDYIRGTDTYWLPSFSYRFQNLDEGGIFIKAGIYPIINNGSDSYSYLSRLPFDNLNLNDKDFVPWIGISTGYTFKPRQHNRQQLHLTSD